MASEDVDLGASQIESDLATESTDNTILLNGDLIVSKGNDENSNDEKTEPLVKKDEDDGVSKADSTGTRQESNVSIEKDKLKLDLKEKMDLLMAFESECSSLKTKVEMLEMEKGHILSDQEKLRLQNESLNVKVNEVVHNIEFLSISIYDIMFLTVEKALHCCQ